MARVRHWYAAGPERGEGGALAQDSRIEFASDGETAQGHLALPPSGRGPGVLVLQEWWGLVPHIREVADRLARAGFVALAPDLYRGETTDDPDAAGRLMLGLDLPRAARDLDGAVEALLRHDAVEGARLGAVGFCMGGQLALYAASRNRRIGAVADFYGVHPDVSPDFAGMRAAVLGVFAERDEFVRAAAVEKLQRELAEAGVRASIEIVPGVQHAFMNDTRPDVHDAAAAERCWDRLLAFLRAELA